MSPSARRILCGFSYYKKQKISIKSYFVFLGCKSCSSLLFGLFREAGDDFFTVLSQGLAARGGVFPNISFYFFMERDRNLDAFKLQDMPKMFMKRDLSPPEKIVGICVRHTIEALILNGHGQYRRMRPQNRRKKRRLKCFYACAVGRGPFRKEKNIRPQADTLFNFF